MPNLRLPVVLLLVLQVCGGNLTPWKQFSIPCCHHVTLIIVGDPAAEKEATVDEGELHGDDAMLDEAAAPAPLPPGRAPKAVAQKKDSEGSCFVVFLLRRFADTLRISRFLSSHGYVSSF